METPRGRLGKAAEPSQPRASGGPDNTTNLSLATQTSFHAALAPLTPTTPDGDRPLHQAKLRLGPLDQVQIRKYTPRLFLLPMAEERSETVANAVSALRLAVQRTLARWPFLGGRLYRCRIGSSQQGGDDHGTLFEVRYTVPALDVVQSGVFHAQTLSDFSYSYEELMAARAPPSALDCVLLLGRSEEGLGMCEKADGGAQFPVLRVQANFIPGGLLLGFMDAHLVADGAAAEMVVEEVAKCLEAGNAMSSADKTKPVEVEGVRRVGSNIYADQPDTEDGHKDRQGKTLVQAATPTVEALLGFDIPDPQPTPTTGGKPTSRVLIIPAATLARMKAAVTDMLHHLQLPGFVSTQDVLSAILWKAMIMARAPRLSNDENSSNARSQPLTARFCTAVDARGKGGPIASDYFGNAVVFALAALPLADLVLDTPDPAAAGITHHRYGFHIPSLARAAYEIRAAITAIASDPSFIPARLAACNASLAAGHPTAQLAHLTHKLDLPATGTFITSWAGMGADVQWRIPGLAGGGRAKADCVRKPWCVGEGAVNILPRRGGSETRWEVLVRLGEGDMERFLGKLESVVEKAVM